MAYSLQDTTDLTSLGDAIRAKTGGSSNMTVAEMATAVASIGGSGGDITTVRWNNNTSGGSSNGYYRSISKNTNVTYTASNLPSHFYLVYEPCSVGSTGVITRQGVVIVEYNNGTTTHLSYGGILTIPIFTITISQSGSSTSIVFRHSQASGTWGFDIVDEFGYTDATDEFHIVPDYREGCEVFVETFLEVSRKLVPVDTGYLQSTLSAKFRNTFCECYTNCEYAQYQEYGTWCMPAQPYFEIALEAALYEAAPYWDDAEEEAWEEMQMQMSRAGGRGPNVGLNWSSPSAFIGSLLAMFVLAVVVVTIQAMFGRDFSSHSRGGRGRGSGGAGSVYVPDIEIT